MSESQRDQPGAIHQPGIEPGANEWEPFILPLNHWCPVSVGATPHPKTFAETVDRTRDLQIFSLTLSQLSYFG